MRARTAARWSSGRAASATSTLRELGVGHRLDALEHLVRELDARHPHPPARPALDVAAAMEGHELAPRDAVQPRRRRAALGREAPTARQRGRERLRREVGGQLGVADAAAEVGDDAADVRAVERRERLGVVGGGEQQGVVVAVGLHA